MEDNKKALIIILFFLLLLSTQPILPATARTISETNESGNNNTNYVGKTIVLYNRELLANDPNIHHEPVYGPPPAPMLPRCRHCPHKLHYGKKRRSCYCP